MYMFRGSYSQCRPSHSRWNRACILANDHHVESIYQDSKMLFALILTSLKENYRFSSQCIHITHFSPLGEERRIWKLSLAIYFGRVRQVQGDELICFTIFSDFLRPETLIEKKNSFAFKKIFWVGYTLNLLPALSATGNDTSRPLCRYRPLNANWLEQLLFKDK